MLVEIVDKKIRIIIDKEYPLKDIDDIVSDFDDDNWDDYTIVLSKECSQTEKFRILINDEQIKFYIAEDMNVDTILELLVKFENWDLPVVFARPASIYFTIPEYTYYSGSTGSPFNPPFTFTCSDIYTGTITCSEVKGTYTIK